MTPDKDLKEKVDELYAFMQALQNSTTIPQSVDAAFTERFGSTFQLPDGMENAPLGAITSPTGGTTIDGEARASIGTIIDRLQDLGLIS